MVPGFYGKLPAKGDFIQRGVGPGFTGPWDNWLQTSMEHSRAKLQNRWLNTYLVSPLWRFCLAPDLLSQNAMAGIMMPSVDSVGRYFPLTLVAEIPPGQDLLMFTQQQDPWFEALEQLALYGLSNEFNFNQFEQLLENNPVILVSNGVSSLPPGERRMGWQSEGQSGAQVVAGVSCSHLTQQLLTGKQGFSLWWTLGSDAVAPSFLMYQGLPPVEDYASLISGEW